MHCNVILNRMHRVFIFQLTPSVVCSALWALRDSCFYGRHIHPFYVCSYVCIRIFHQLGFQCLSAPLKNLSSWVEMAGNGNGESF